MTQPHTAPLDSREDFKANPKDQYRYWATELDASDRLFRDFLKQGDRIMRRFLAKPGGNTRHDEVRGEQFRMNLFNANVTTIESTLYGSVPKIDVSRRYQDANDDTGRVAALIMQRLLNNDFADRAMDYESVLRTDLLDYLTVGLGTARCRYVPVYEDISHAAVQTTDGMELSPAWVEHRLVKEDVEIDYIHWRDVRWGWCRNYAEIRWMGYRFYMTRDEATERFGEDTAKKLTYERQVGADEVEARGDDTDADAWQKCEIWEIWDRTEREVVWVNRGYDKVLDTKKDPLGLRHFFPGPRPMVANVTSSLFMPTADYILAQDLYTEIDRLQSRISIITEAVKVVGVYDGASGDVGRMMKEGTDNDLIPVDNWALFAEKGGLKGVIDWFPIEDVVKALVQLVTMRDQTIALLQQITGMSDLMRGELKNQYEGVGQTAMKAQFGSVRLQALQDKFARFAGDLMAVKAEIIARHFDPQTILARANMQHSFDADLAQKAVALIKTPEQARLSIEIRPESVSMIDYSALKAERTEFLTALATFMQSAAPLIEGDPSTKPFLLQLLQWGLAGFKGAKEIEGVIDKAIEQSQKAAQEQQGKPDPAAAAEQMKAQMAQQLEQMKAQLELQKIDAKKQADLEVRQADMQADMQTLMTEHKSAMEQAQQALIADLAEVKAKMQADIQKEISQSQAQIMQIQAGAAAEMEKDAQSSELEIQKDVVKTGLRLDELAEQTRGKMAVKKAKPEKPAGGRDDKG